jgi:lysosomal alpha-mannosidase
MDAMIGYMNAKYPDYNFIYSTPSKYVDAIKELEVKWPVKHDDMFPYSDHPHAYWTGYFSSRANSKEFIRRGSHNLHATQNVYAEKMFDQGLEKAQLKEILATKATMMDSMGILQHHDAVSGTEKQKVD